MFAGFSEETIQFFLGLRFHNQKSFFEENREAFQAYVQAPFYALIEDLSPVMAKIDPGMELRPYKCLARIYRDTRFSKDKSPYRDHLWVLLRRAAEPRDQGLTYWFELSPEWVNWGMGFWSENRPVMDLMRRRMAAHPQSFMALIDGCQLEKRHLELSGTSFKRMEAPPGIPDRLKPWYLSKEFFIHRTDADMRWIYSPSLVKRVAGDFKALAPLYRTLRGYQDDLAAAAE